MKQSLLLLFIFFLSCGNNYKAEIFDKEKWKKGTQIERGNMSTDLVKSEMLIGKTKSEIIDLLGEPKDSTRTNFHYLVDFGYMTPFDLNIWFDKDNLRVNKTDLSD
jgi:hypothetical protein